MDAVNPKKRVPDENGVLDLTDEELKEFGLLVCDNNIAKIKIDCIGGVEYFVNNCNELCNHRTVYEIKAIIWLAERFNLEDK